MDVFVYDTLLDPHQALAVVPDATFGADATLLGLHAVEGESPTLAPGGTVEGQLLATEQLDALDRYEGVGDRIGVRVTVPTDDGRTVEVYVGDPARSDAEESVEWPGEGPLAERVQRHVEEEGVVVSVE